MEQYHMLNVHPKIMGTAIMKNFSISFKNRINSACDIKYKMTTLFR